MKINLKNSIALLFLPALLIRLIVFLQLSQRKEEQFLAEAASGIEQANAHTARLERKVTVRTTELVRFNVDLQKANEEMLREFEERMQAEAALARSGSTPKLSR